MARASQEDLYQLMRFSVETVAGPAGALPAGQFRNCSIPEFSVEATEFREGTRTFARKQPGLATVNNLTLSRGVVKKDSGFYKWMVAVLACQEYKADLLIRQFHRSSWLSGDTPAQPCDLEMGGDPASKKPQLAYHIFNAQPTRLKHSGDLDATSGDVAVSELDVAYEYFTVEQLS